MNILIYLSVIGLWIFDIWYKSKHSLRVEKRCNELEYQRKEYCDKYLEALGEAHALRTELKRSNEDTASDEEKYLIKTLRKENARLCMLISATNLQNSFLKNKLANLTEFSEKMEKWASEEVTSNNRLSKENHELRLKYYGDTQKSA